MKRLILFLLLFSSVTGMLFAAGTGTIKGIVADAITGERLPGAAVLIKDKFLGTYTDINGQFILTNVPAGSNTLNVNYLGYKEQVLSVDVVAGQTQTIDIALEVLTTQVEEVVVTAQIRGQRAAINQQLASNTVANVISSEKMQELPDANAAEAIGRLPGISLKRNAGEADKIVIRGLSPKYSNVTIEGIKMASTSDFDRSVDLSMVQSEMLSGVEVLKSLRPDMDADALGGTVNLRLMEAPSKRQIELDLEGGYTNLNKSFGNYKVTGGFSDRFFNKKLGVNLRLDYERKDMPSQQFSGTYQSGYWDYKSNAEGVYDSSLLTRTQQVGLIDQAQIRKRGNGSLILDWHNDWWSVKFFNMFSQKNDNVITRDNEYIFSVSGTPQNFTLNVTDAEWKTFTRTHTLQNTFRFGNSKIDIDLSATYADAKESEQSFPFVEVNDWGLNDPLVYRQPKSIMDQIGGAEALKIEDSYLQQMNMASQSLIDKGYDVKADYELGFSLFDKISGKLKLGGKYHQLNRVSDGTGRYYDLQWGGSVARRQTFLATFPWVVTNLNSQRGINADNFVDHSYNPGEFLNGRYDLGWTANVGQLEDMQNQLYKGPTDGNYTIQGLNSYQRDYEATEKVGAAYVEAELNIGSKLMLLPGVRVETYKTEYFAYHIRLNSGLTGIDANPDSVTTKTDNSKWFPSLNMKFKVNDAISIQGAAYKSTSRPSFREISPLVVYPNTGNYIQSNNPYLFPSSAWNFDLGVSVKNDKIGLFTIYGFYKEISDLIFTMNGYKPYKKGLIVGGPADLDSRILGAEYYNPFYLNAGGTTNLPINNPEKAYVSGIELSWQTSFWYLPGVLKGLVLDVNYTLLNTQTKYPYFQSVQIGVDSSGFIPQPIYGQQYMTRNGPMQDQPEQILNVILGWDFKGFSARVSYRYQAKTVESLDARYSVFDQYYDTFSLWDLMLNQKITKNVGCYANLSNIGNHIDDYYFGAQPAHGSYPARAALPTSSQFYGMRAQIGVRISL